MDINGWLLIDKNFGKSSYYVINQLKKLLNPKKIGHAGTLDPLATGALAVALGEATKTVDFIMGKAKTYEFTLQFGIATNTYDAEGEITEVTSVIPSQNEILEILPQFKGEIEETPPSFSAIKINGVRAYKLARKNQAVSIPKRKVWVDYVKLLDYNPLLFQATFEAKVGKGAYIRSLGFKIAATLKSTAYITRLRRTKIEGFKEKTLLPLYQLYNNVNLIKRCIIPIEEALDDIPAIEFAIEEAKAISMGKSLTLEQIQTDSTYNCYQGLYKGKLISLLQIKNGKTKVLRNFNQISFKN